MEEVLEVLCKKPGGVYLDVTFGGGGHTSEILKKDPEAKVIALDWDMRAIERAQPLVEHFGKRLTLVWGSFAHLYKLQKKRGIYLRILCVSINRVKYINIRL